MSHHAHSQRIFDTDNALRGSFNGRFGRWQNINYIVLVFGYAVVFGWINHLLEFSLLVPKDINCNMSQILEQTPGFVNFTNRSFIQRISGKGHVEMLLLKTVTLDNGTELPEPVYSQEEFRYAHESPSLGITAISEYEMLCDNALKNAPIWARMSHSFGFMVGAFLLASASDHGGRKIIVQGCLWTVGLMSMFQLVGRDYLSFVFFQFFLGLFVGGAQSTFLPLVMEMFPISFRTFYGVFFHVIVCLFYFALPPLAKFFAYWVNVQLVVTLPIVLTATLQWLGHESIFWHLAHKEYDKAIQTLTKLAKRNGIKFESRFKQAKEFLHAKHSKSTQIDMLPLIRLQDVEVIGKKYPQIDMAELQRQQAESNKLRRFLNSLKGSHYRSTNTVYRPFDFFYSPPLLIYVFILCGLWFVNGLTESMELPTIRLSQLHDPHWDELVFAVPPLMAALLATALAFVKVGRRWMIFVSYLLIEICLFGSIVEKVGRSDEQRQQSEAMLVVLYCVCRLAAYFGLIFLMLLTCELFPTSLRCTGLAICIVMRCLGAMIASPLMLDHSTWLARLLYGILTLLFGSLTIFLPETRTYPLPRSILQIEAMPTAIGKKLRSRKVRLAVERRQAAPEYSVVGGGSILDRNQRYKSTTVINDANNNEVAKDKSLSPEHIPLIKMDQQPLPGSASSSPSHQQQAGGGGASGGGGSPAVPQLQLSPQTSDGAGVLLSSVTIATAVAPDATYDTVSSVHDIEQDWLPSRTLEYEQRPALSRIVEVPSRSITRQNSRSDLQQN